MLQIFQTLVIALTLMTIGIAQASDNLVNNPSVENGDGAPAAWKFSNWDDSTGAWDDQVAVGEGKSLKISGLNGGWNTTINVQAGKLHNVSLSYRQVGGSAKIVTYVRILESGKKPLLYRSHFATPANKQSGFVDGQFIEGADKNGWVRYEAGTFMVPDDATSVNLLVKLVGSSPEATLWLDDFHVAAFTPQEIPETAATLQQIDGACIWTDDANRKILIDQAIPDHQQDVPLSLDLARGEYGVFQVAVTPNTTWKQVDWKCGKFASGDTDHDFHLNCRKVEYVNIDNAREPFGRSGLHPDPLTESLPCDITPDKNQTFWFTLHIPQNQRPGNYNTTLRLFRSSSEIAKVPLHVLVRDFALPDKPSIDVVSRMHSTEVRAAESGADDDVLKRYYDSYFSHRTRCAVAAPVGVRLKDEKAIVNSDLYVEHRRYVRDNFGKRPFFLPALWISHSHHQMPPDASWKGRRVFADAAMDRLNPDFERPFRDFATQLVERLKKEDLFAEPVVRFIDEPVLAHAPTRTAIRTLAKFLKSIDPQIRVALTTTSPHAELFSVIDHWVLHTDAWDRGLANITAARAAGNQISVYNNGIAYVEQERIRIRLWPWLLKKYNVAGTYSWCGTTNWRNERADPWNNGISYFEVLFYPPRHSNEHGPIESVRWELFRQGLQDYEYLKLTEHLIDQCEAARTATSTKAATTGRSALDNAMSLVERWPRVRPTNDRPYSRDVTKLAAALEHLADAIETMQQSLGQ